MADLDPSIIERSVEKTHIWLKEIADELGGADRHYAYRAVRAVLHALRDRLPVRQMRLEEHLAKTTPGLAQRIAQRLRALTLVNIQIGRPPRALAAYDGR